jgi:hypothetical protein
MASSGRIAAVPAGAWVASGDMGPITEFGRHGRHESFSTGAPERGLMSRPVTAKPCLP